MNKTLLSLALTAGALAFPVLDSRADWPAYRGPYYNGISPEKFAPGAWPALEPRVLWKVPTDTGFSSFAVAGGKAYTLVARDGREICIALDANTGKELWAAPFGNATYARGGDSGTPENKGGDGPRSTPTVDGNLVYVFDANLLLACLDAATGKTLWSKDLAKDFGGKNIHWENAASPIVVGDLVYVAGGGPGQSLIAFNKKNGSVAWKGFDETITHATPIPAIILSTPQIIYFLKSGLLSVSLKEGKELWRYSFPFQTSTAASPVVSGDIVYCSAGYGVGAGAVKITKSGTGFTATEIWRTRNDNVNHWSTPVVKDGHLYGMFSFKKYGQGPVNCIELATGKVKWSQDGFGPGNVILAGDRLLALNDQGELVLIDAKPTAYKELGRYKAIGGKCWSTPALSNGRVYVRSTTEGACVDLGGKATASK